MKIVYQGSPGAYSHLAAKKMYPDFEPISQNTFEECFNLCLKNESYRTIIPVENSIAGRVADIQYLINKYKLQIYAEHFQPITHNLMILPNSSMKNISSVRSHTQAISQCQKIILENKDNITVEIANDNSVGQIVLSGKNNDLEKLIEILKSNNIKNIKLPVSAPFHCKLMNNATQIMKKEIEKKNFQDSNKILISNVTANEISNKEELKRLLIEQIEKRVRWRESVINMINHGVNHFIEIGPGKVLSGLVKRINKNVKIDTINSQGDIEGLKI